MESNLTKFASGLNMTTQHNLIQLNITQSNLTIFSKMMSFFILPSHWLVQNQPNRCRTTYTSEMKVYTRYGRIRADVFGWKLGFKCQDFEESQICTKSRIPVEKSWLSNLLIKPTSKFNWVVLSHVKLTSKFNWVVLSHVESC